MGNCPEPERPKNKNNSIQLNQIIEKYENIIRQLQEKLKEREPIFVGLINIGESSYMNATQ